MLRHVAIAADRPATFEGGADAVTEVLKKAGIDTTGLRLHDGSGLSRDDRISPDDAGADRAGGAAPACRHRRCSTDLPVSGFNGTLTTRFAKSQARVRAGARQDRNADRRALARRIRRRCRRPAGDLRAHVGRHPDRSTSSRRRPRSTGWPPRSRPARVRHARRTRCRRMIDWKLALSTATRLTKPGPEMDAAEVAEAVAELREGAARSEGPVREFSGLHATSATAPVLVVDRPRWIEANLDTFRRADGPRHGQARREPTRCRPA